MNDTSGSDLAQHAAPVQSADSLAPPLAPWGVRATIAWGAAAFLAELTVQLVVVAAFLVFGDVTLKALLDSLSNNQFMQDLLTVLAAPASVGVAALAARRRGWRVRDYLALVVPRRGQLLFGIACLAALEISFSLLSSAFGVEEASASVREEYQSMRAAGALPLYFLASALIAPINEEIAFRGFLFRGLSESWLGVTGTVIITSAVWTLMHVNYGWVTLGRIFLLGLLFGWLRWTSGSTVLTIMLHAVLNFLITALGAMQVEGMI